MSIEPRVVVTGRTAEDTSVFVIDRPTEAVTLGALPGTEFHLLWGTGEGVPEVGTGTGDPGSTVVQRGTRHAWHNRSDKPALMCYVLVGADRAG